MRKLGRTVLVAAVALCCARLWAESGAEDLRKEIDDLRRQLKSDNTAEATIQDIDILTDSHVLGVAHDAATRAGKLQVGGLLQIWEQDFFHDRRDVFGNTAGELLNNGNRRIRRAELTFEMDITENISSFVMIDPANEITDYPNTPSDQGLFKSSPTTNSDRNGANLAGLRVRGVEGLSKAAPFLAALNPASIVDQVRTGTGESNRLLEDAYINVHGIVPHHDFTVGQFRPPSGEEGTRADSNLDFIERAMVTQLTDLRDLGAQVHGSWWEDCETNIGRLQYWAGIFDGAGNYFDTAGDFQNRADDNDSKDVIGKLMVRPIWSECMIGKVELGAWGEFGNHGESGDHTADGTNPDPGLDRLKTHAYRWGAWAMYKPMACLKGLWFRSEYAAFRDRTAPNTVDAFGLGSGPDGAQASPNPFKREGWYVSAGYKLTDSIFGNSLAKGSFFNRLVEPTEFVIRYESFENIIVENAAHPDQLSDLYSTRVFTMGVNYYIKAYKHRVQINYMNVRESVNPNQHPGIRGPQDDMYVVSYQIQF